MPTDVYDKIMTVAKRRGFLYPSFDIYGGVAGFYNYGPLGSQLKKNIEDIFRDFYLLKDNCVEISTPTVTLYEVLKASGHVDKFLDITVECKKCNQSYKAEDILEEDVPVEEGLEKGLIKCPKCGNVLKEGYPVNLMFSTEIGIGKTRDGFLRPETAQGIFTDFHLLYRYAREKLPLGVIQIGRGYRNEVSPRQGIIRLREFSMAEAEIFLDPENKTHPEFENIKKKKLYLYNNERKKDIIAEKAVEKQIIKNEALAYYMYLTQEFLISIGINKDKFRFRKHREDELAHYASECWDAEAYSERFGWIECVGIADRSAYDLKSHTDASDTDMHATRKYEKPETVKIKKIEPKMDVIGPQFKGKAGKIKQALEEMDAKKKGDITLDIDGEKVTISEDCYDIVEKEEKITGEKFLPHVIEPSYGIDRILYCILEHNYKETTKEGEKYRLLKLENDVAPVKTGVFPLVNNEKLIRIAKEIDKELRKNGISCYYDESGSIGRRYARMDEIGTPFCITVDYDTLEDDTVTVRERDTTKQKRKKIEELADYLKEKTFRHY